MSTAGKSDHAHRDLLGHPHLGLKLLHFLQGGVDLTGDRHLLKLREIIFFIILKFAVILWLKHVIILDCCNKLNQSKHIFSVSTFNLHLHMFAALSVTQKSILPSSPYRPRIVLSKLAMLMPVWLSGKSSQAENANSSIVR